MTAKRIRIQLLAVLCLTAGLLSGCVSEDRSVCLDPFTLTVKVSVEAQTNSTPNDVDDVILFIFDSGRHYMYSIKTRVGESVELADQVSRDLYVVAWGNLGLDGRGWAEPTPGDPLPGCFISLVPDTRAGTLMLPPDDLFMGAIELSQGDRTREKVVEIRRQVGSMTVRVHRLQEFAGYNDQDYHIVVRGIPSRMSLGDGAASGTGAEIRPEGRFVTVDNRQVYEVPVFNLFPSKEIEIDIYHDTDLIVTVSEDSDRKKIKVERDRTTQVEIDLRTAVEVTVGMNDWNKTDWSKEF